MSHCAECFQTDGFHREFCIHSDRSVGTTKKIPINIPVVPEGASLQSYRTEIDPKLRLETFVVKDSGERQKFESGMSRDVTTGKVQIGRVFDGPMLKRWAEHITKGATKYPDIRPGVPNWTLASGEEELARFKDSAARHFWEWYTNSNPSEDSAAGIFFNVNGAEFVKEKLRANKDK